MMSDEQIDKAYYKMLEKQLDEMGYRSTIPVDNYLSRNYSDALAEIDFWVRQKVILRKETT